MVKHLTPIGNSLGIVIDRPVLDLLNITRDTLLEVSTDGEALILRPTRARTAAESAARMMDIHAEALKKLAK